MTEDEKYMRRCIQLAKNGMKNSQPNPMVGAVIVCNGRIIGEGYHQRCGEGHAEVNAIASVKETELLSQSTIYVSLEPCSHYGKTPPCADLIISKGIPKVVVGCLDPFAKVNGLGIKKLRDAGIAVIIGVLEAECLALNKRFMTFHSLHRPFVTLKWAQSADGFIAAEGQHTHISNSLAQSICHKRRAEHQAIIVGRVTAETDNPHLDVRKWEGNNPIRVVIDRERKLPSTLHLFDGSIPTIVFTQDGSDINHEKSQNHTVVMMDGLQQTNVTYEYIDFSTDIIPQILKRLHSRGVQSLLVEGGTRLLQSFIDSEMWDEAFVETGTEVIYQGVEAPRIHHAQVVEVTPIDNHTMTFLTKTKS